MLLLQYETDFNLSTFTVLVFFLRCKKMMGFNKLHPDEFKVFIIKQINTKMNRYDEVKKK